MTSPETVFKDEDHSEFDNVILRFTIQMRNELCNGCKISGRYGNKGTIAGIYPDDKMPYDEDGNHVDIALNNQGVVNRLNSAQLNEVELNYASNYVVNSIKKDKKLESKMLKVIEFLEIVNPLQAKRYSQYWSKMDEKGKKEFIKDIEKDGLYLHCPPFFNTPNYETLFKIYDKYGEIKPKQFYIKDDSGKVIKIDNPLISSDMYMIRLKHDSISKFSVRSGGALSLSGVPSKNNKKYKEGKARYSKTAVRIGEMELINLFITNNIKEVHRFISQYSSNSEDRKALAERLLGIDLEHFNESVFDIKKVDLTGKKSLTKMMLDTYLGIIGMKLV
jgi:DNA-directed RNA polymerase beta subunit